jgi:broad specificity phosphatase PhoE
VPGRRREQGRAAARFAGALDELLARPEEVVVAVSHALPVRYVLDAADGTFPAPQIGRIPHATPFELDADAVARAAETLRAWAAAPRFREPVQAD